MKKYLWLAVTADEYELPLIVADTAKELANKCGITTGTVKSSVYQNCSGIAAGRKLIKVEVKE